MIRDNGMNFVFRKSTVYMSAEAKATTTTTKIKEEEKQKKTETYTQTVCMSNSKRISEQTTINANK